MCKAPLEELEFLRARLRAEQSESHSKYKGSGRYYFVECGKLRTFIQMGLTAGIGCLGLVCCAGCATTDAEITTRAHPATIINDSFDASAPPTYHKASEYNSKPFFFKDCQPAGEATHYSKTSFFCSDREGF